MPTGLPLSQLEDPAFVLLINLLARRPNRTPAGMMLGEGDFSGPISQPELADSLGLTAEGQC